MSMSPHSETDPTIAYYDENAEEYVATTSGVDVRTLYEPFLGLLPEGGHILDAGCGSGRDARYFLSRGYRVTASDGSAEMARIASVYIGIPVSVLRFEEMTHEAEFDGIWACASLLHVRRADLADAFHRLGRALRPGGILYASFKKGETDRVVGGRRFTDFTLDKLRGLVLEEDRLAIVRLWETMDCRSDHMDDGWINMLAQRREAPRCLGQSRQD
jgi:SAM-dependent methyltransferase